MLAHMSTSANTTKTSITATWSNETIARLVGQPGQMGNMARREQRRRNAA